MSNIFSTPDDCVNIDIYYKVVTVAKKKVARPCNKEDKDSKKLVASFKRPTWYIRNEIIRHSMKISDVNAYEKVVCPLRYKENELKFLLTQLTYEDGTVIYATDEFLETISPEMAEGIYRKFKEEGDDYAKSFEGERNDIDQLYKDTHKYYAYAMKPVEKRRPNEQAPLPPSMVIAVMLMEKFHMQFSEIKKLTENELRAIFAVMSQRDSTVENSNKKQGYDSRSPAQKATGDNIQKFSSTDGSMDQLEAKMKRNADLKATAKKQKHERGAE